MRRVLAGVAVAAIATFSGMSAHASAPTPSNPAGRELGVVPVHGMAKIGATAGSNLAYHSGGTVETGTHTTYAIYWNPYGSTFGPSYDSVINKYFTDVAHDSGLASNVYYSDTQYYQNFGTQKNITYSESFGGAATDTTAPTGTGCSSTSGGTAGCISDAQIQAEVAAVAKAHGWTTGTSAEFFVFLGKGLSTCYSSSSCFVSQFCAYHSNFSSGGSTYLYANMPYTGFNAAACGTGVTPNNNQDADSTINVTSHEANETITDALGNAWYDRRGNENGDKCAWNFGAGGAYNQTINGAHYYLQGEWSNKSSGCVWTGQ